jgi:hypothetical protein
MGELADLWKSAGLSNVQEKGLTIEMQFNTFEDYWRPFLLGQGPAGAYAANLDPRMSQRLQDELKRQLCVSGEGLSFILPARAWAVRGIVPSE